MSSFLRVTDADDDRKVKIEVPMVIPAGAEFNIFATTRAYDEQCIVINLDGEERIRINRNGQIIVRENDGNFVVLL